MISTIQGLVACSDLTGYAKFAASRSDEEMFQLLSDYYEFVGDIIAPASGKVIKFMGDAVLMLFPDLATDAGVRALFDMQNKGDQFLSDHQAPCQHHIRAHFGSLCFGEIGTRRDKRSDIFGSAVNTVFTLKTRGLAITPEAFRKIDPETRKLFQKHTPPVTYISLSEPHRD
jgi:class 3 adenylate cyclase